MCRLSLVVASRGYSSLQCAGFSLRWLLMLQSIGSRRTGFSSCGWWALEHRLSSRGSWALEHRLSSCGSWALEHRLSSCGTRAYLLRGMWDLPGPGLKPVSPALTGGFLSTAPPGKPQSVAFMSDQLLGHCVRIMPRTDRIAKWSARLLLPRHCKSISIACFRITGDVSHVFNSVMIDRWVHGATLHPFIAKIPKIKSRNC